MKNIISTILTILCVLVYSYSFGQNLILNPSFFSTESLPYFGSYLGPNNDFDGGAALDEYWSVVPYWQPPKFNGPIGFAHVGSADILEHTYHSASTSAFLGGKEFIVGEIQPSLITGHLYYYQAYVSSSELLSDGTINVSLCLNRPNQDFSGNDITFNGSFYRFTPMINEYTIANNWYRVAHQFEAILPFDRLAIGSLKPGYDNASVVAGGYSIDDLKLLDLGPGGICPIDRQIQNITYTDEIILYKASETITAGNNVATYTSTGPVIVDGTSDITYRAGHEIELLDGFSVVEGATFSAFIHPCDCETPVASAGPDRTSCDGATVNLGYPGLSYQNYQWSCAPGSGLAYLSDTNVANPIFTPPSTGASSLVYTLTVSNICGESVSEQVRVTYNSIVDNNPIVSCTFNNEVLPTPMIITPGPRMSVIYIKEYDASGNLIGTITLYAYEDFTPDVFFEYQLPTCRATTVSISGQNFCSDVISEPITYTTSGTTPSIEVLSNVMLFGGEAPNDAIWLYHTGYIAYSLEVTSPSGNIPCYEVTNVPITSNQVRLFDAPPGFLCEYGPGTYFFVLDLFGCDGGGAHLSGYWTIMLPSERMADPNLNDSYSSSLDEIKRGYQQNSRNPTLFPNPTTGLITYTGTGPLSTATVMDLTGRTLHTQACNGTTTATLDLSPYQPGTYLLRMQYTTGKAETHRVVRQ